MKITVITINYNNGNHLETTLQSVVSQDYRDIEYILIDGGSTDNSVEVIKRYSSHISSWESTRDKGIYDAMNKGINKATGDWLIFLNSGDCFIHPSVLSAAIKKMDQTDVNYFGDATFTDGAISYQFRSRMSRKSDFLRHNPFCHQAIFYSSSALKRSSLSYDLSYKISSDFVLTYKLFQTSKFENLHQTLAVCMLGGISCENAMQSFHERRIMFWRESQIHYWVILSLVLPFYNLKFRLLSLLKESKILRLYRKFKYRGANG